MTCLHTSKEPPDFLLNIRVFEINNVKFPDDAFAPNGEFCQFRVGISKNVVHKGDSTALLHQIQNDIDAGIADRPLEPLPLFIIATKLLFQNRPGAGACLPVDDGFLQ